ncbi:MAG: hypothetical protein GYB53_19950 [Rhodobacteraceae bacterium]|nr:hypothetical protein [Paracoccaceae bacterium]MBR9822255.1 hypothetical protein [Paracoccaceae bacterium]
MPRSPVALACALSALVLLPIGPAASRAEDAHAAAPAPAGSGHGDAGHGDTGADTGHGTMPPAPEGGLCTGFGPQTPRDIALHAGQNRVTFPLAPPPEAMNLCNIHTHTNAEHKGPGFSVLSTDPAAGGYTCAGADRLTAAERADPAFGHGPFGHVKPGDTIEVHWVFSSCDVQPGPGLGACLSEACSNPTLRVESQVFLVVNDPFALDFATFAHAGTMLNGRPQPRALPYNTGAPVVFRGSTTGPSYSEQACSPLQVTWSVRPNCARLDISSLYRWAHNGNVFEEEHSHGVRALVTAPELLAPIH